LDVLCSPYVVSFVIHGLRPNSHRYFILKIFRTWYVVKLKGTGWRRQVKHRATAVTLRVPSLIVTKDFFLLGISVLSIQLVPTKIIIFSLVRKTTCNAELPASYINCGSKIRGRERSLSLFC